MKGFDDFPPYRKVDIIIKQAEFVSIIDHNNYTFMLYRLDTSFIEVRYDKYLDEVIEIKLVEDNYLHLYCPTLCELHHGI